MTDGCHVGKYWKFYDTPTDGPIGTKLRWSHPNNTSTSKPLLVVIANRTVHALCGFMSCFMGCNGQKNIHTFDETLSLYSTMLQIISGKKTGNFNTKTLRR